MISNKSTVFSNKAYTAQQYTYKFNQGFSAGLETFNIIVIGIFFGLALNYAVKIVLSRKDNLTDKEKRFLSMLESVGLQFSFTLSIYLVLMLTVFRKALKVSIQGAS